MVKWYASVSLKEYISFDICIGEILTHSHSYYTMPLFCLYYWIIDIISITTTMVGDPGGIKEVYIVFCY